MLAPGDPVLPGQLPLRVDVDHAALDIVPGQTRRQGLELGPELAQQISRYPPHTSTHLLARPAPVSVELYQRVRARVDEGVEVVAGELGGGHGHGGQGGHLVGRGSTGHTQRPAGDILISLSHCSQPHLQ